MCRNVRLLSSGESILWRDKIQLIYLTYLRGTIVSGVSFLSVHLYHVRIVANILSGDLMLLQFWFIFSSIDHIYMRWILWYNAYFISPELLHKLNRRIAWILQAKCYPFVIRIRWRQLFIIQDRVNVCQWSLPLPTSLSICIATKIPFSGIV